MENVLAILLSPKTLESHRDPTATSFAIAIANAIDGEVEEDEEDLEASDLIRSSHLPPCSCCLPWLKPCKMHSRVSALLPPSSVSPSLRCPFRPFSTIQASIPSLHPIKQGKRKLLLEKFEFYSFSLIAASIKQVAN
jgi:hypothetical protein